ncbi:MAG: extracellular solute-binding protein [Oscillospiraceae bacterium]|nr:extracellular solute-binding protein [Oscillospiraceae bacterium]
MYYNPSILNEVGVTLPETWSQVQEVSQAILDYYGFEVYPWGVNLTTDEGAFTFACYIYNNGGAFLTDSAWSLNSEENKAAMTYLSELINWGYTNHDPAEDSFDTLLELFQEGEQAMFIGPYSLDTELAETGQSYAVGQLPANDGLTACSVGIASTLAVFADEAEENPEARTEAIATLLDFLFDAERYTALSEAVGLLPVTNTAISALTEQRALSGNWEAVLTNCRFLPRWKDDWDTVNARLVELEQTTLIGEDSAALLDSLQAEITVQE